MTESLAVPCLKRVFAPTERFLNHDKHGVPYTPGKISPGRAVPDTRRQKDDNQIDIGTKLPLAIAAERKIKKLLKPRRQRNMPPGPKLTD